MSKDCKQWLDDLTIATVPVLNDDLAALSRDSAQVRIDRYNKIKDNENELRREFREECRRFRTESELEEIRQDFRFARLKIAASFYRDGELPQSLEGEFEENALEAVVDFERYKQFSELSENQINRRIRRMDGQVYELVQEYTNTQLANLDELTGDHRIQGDLFKRLNDKYDERMEKIRQGVFIYVEEHGLGATVEEVEDAIEQVSKAEQKRIQIETSFEEELERLSDRIDRGFREQQQTVEQQLRSVEREVAASDPELEQIRAELEQIDLNEITEQHQQTTAELDKALDRTRRLEANLEEQITELKAAKQAASDSANSAVGEEIASLVSKELQSLEQQREQIKAEIDRLKSERASLETARERLSKEQQELSDRVDEIEMSVEDNESGIDGDSVVTAPIARLMELDYIGRFETSLDDTSTIRIADDDNFVIPDGYWDERIERRNERPRVRRLVEDQQSIETVPVNLSARGTVAASGILSLSTDTRIVIETTVVSDLEAHAANGFDSTPADLDDFLAHVDDVVQKAEQNDVPYLLGITSPTGWTDAVRRQVTSESVSRTRFSRRVSVVLVDLQDGALVFDESDVVARENRRLFELPVDDERVQACRNDISARFDQQGSFNEGVLVDELVERGNYKPHIVKRAFDYYSRRGNCHQRYVDGDLVLFRGE